VAQEKTGSGKDQFDALRASEARLQALVDASVRRESERIAIGDDRTLSLVATITALALLAFVGIGVFARRWVLDPIDRVASAARQVARGDLDRPVVASGPPELLALAVDVEAMRRRLRDELAEAERSREALEQQAPLLSSVRRELAPSMAVGDEPVSVAARLLPATGVLAGDWYDVLSPKPGVVSATLVDISGHGPDAGLFAYQLKNLLTAALRIYDDPGACLGWVADQLGDTEDRFATALLLRFDLREGTCQWANAGHPAALRFRAGTCVEMPPTGPLLGPLPGTWESGTIDVELGADTFVAYTDGISEAHRPGGDLFGDDRLRRAVRSGLAGGPAAVVEATLAAVASHTGQRLADDATVVVIQPGR
jgi:sigma-B regulation protein RsbU (phosphoserine phosphatase)